MRLTLCAFWLIFAFMPNTMPNTSQRIGGLVRWRITRTTPASLFLTAATRQLAIHSKDEFRLCKPNKKKPIRSWVGLLMEI